MEKLKAAEAEVKLVQHTSGVAAAVHEFLKSRYNNLSNVRELKDFLKNRGLPKGRWQVGVRASLVSELITVLNEEEKENLFTRAAVLKPKPKARKRQRAPRKRGCPARSRGGRRGGPKTTKALATPAHTTVDSSNDSADDSDPSLGRNSSDDSDPSLGGDSGVDSDEEDINSDCDPDMVQALQISLQPLERALRRGAVHGKPGPSTDSAPLPGHAGEAELFPSAAAADQTFEGLTEGDLRNFAYDRYGEVWESQGKKITSAIASKHHELALQWSASVVFARRAMQTS